MQWRDDTTLPSQGRVGGMTAWGQTLPSRDLLAKVALHIVASGVAQCSWAVFLHRPTTNSSLHLWMTPASGPSRAIPCRQCARSSQHRRQPDWAAVMPNPDFRYTPEPVGAPSRIITQSRGRCFPSDPHLQKSALRMSWLGRVQTQSACYPHCQTMARDSYGCQSTIAACMQIADEGLNERGQDGRHGTGGNAMAVDAGAKLFSSSPNAINTRYSDHPGPWAQRKLSTKRKPALSKTCLT
jgi:hypothetical protein